MTPQLDVTELFHDPDFVDDIMHVARRSVVNNLGENQITEISTPTCGSVQPSSAAALLRIPESERIANLKSFWIQGTIVASAPGKYTDILIFRKLRFQVKTVFDWTSWGAGWCEGLCVAEVPAP